MEYPIWQLESLAGGFWVALIATVHVFVALFAVGGGLFLPVMEQWAAKADDKGLLAYVRKHTKFFLLLTMVFGGLTGVGIWFSIALVSPRATSELIRTFVFGWATEWTFFLGEIIALLVYYYTWDKMDRKTHIKVGWLYFVFAWLSLFVINGILSFMLTPGSWLESRNFWDGFFNPTFTSSLFYRSFLSAMLAGLFGFVTATRIADRELRAKVVRACSMFTLAGFVLTFICAYWYLHSVPAVQFDNLVLASPRVLAFIKSFWMVAPAVFVGGLIMAIRMPAGIKTPLAFVLLLVAFAMVGNAEFARESARKPYVIYDYMYSSSIKPDEVARINKEGALAVAKWTPPHAAGLVDSTEDLRAGKFLFQLQCASCHSINGPLNDIKPRVAKFGEEGMDSFLTGIGLLNRYMPPFMGTTAERRALARYIVADINGKELGSENEVVAPRDLPFDIPPRNDEYVLLAWNNLGMHCISDSDDYWVLLPPANDIFAQLVRRGEYPEVVTENIKIVYEVEEGFRNPAAHSRFWANAESIFGAADLPENVGLAGKGVTGVMDKHEEGGFFEAKLIPVVPYPDDGTFNPYPHFTVKAVDEKTGNVLAQTKTVAPTSTEMGCKNCHGGGWKHDGVAGISGETSRDLLAIHDRREGTNLLAEAEAGNPKLCQGCHPDPVLGTKGQPGVLGFPAAIHGFHASFLTDRGTEACFNCHPSRPQGPTLCLRGVHAERGLDCTSCHGYMEDHALSLLKKEQELGKETAAELMEHLTPRRVDSVDDVVGRTPWLNEPDCLTCHENYGKADPTDPDSFNAWTEGGEELYRNRHDEMGTIMCIACHNSPHANYPTVNKLGKDRDNVQPIQYMGFAGPIGAKGNCTVCHQEMPWDSGHHPGLLKQPQ